MKDHPPGEDSILKSMSNLRDSIASLGNGLGEADDLSESIRGSQMFDLRKIDDLEFNEFAHHDNDHRVIVHERGLANRAAAHGGPKIVNFIQDGDNDWQPEAARMMFSAFEMAIKLADLPRDCIAEDICDGKITPQKTISRNNCWFDQKDKKRKGLATDRHIVIHVPDDKAQDFADALEKVARKIASSGQHLVRNYEDAMQLSLDSINSIDGAKPFIQLEGSVHSRNPLGINLMVQNVPNDLVVELKKCQGVSIGRVSGATHSRDLKREFPGGGREVTIDVGSPGFAQVRKIIQDYVARLAPQQTHGATRDHLPVRRIIMLPQAEEISSEPSGEDHPVDPWRQRVNIDPEVFDKLMEKPRNLPAPEASGKEEKESPPESDQEREPPKKRTGGGGGWFGFLRGRGNQNGPNEEPSRF